jgi:methyl-accepting chemotaxis protein
LTIDLSSAWSVTESDNAVFSASDCDSSTWKKTDLPGKIVTGKKQQVLWLRKEFVLPAGFGGGKDLAFVLGKVWDAEDTWFNGVKIGGMGSSYPEFFSKWNTYRYYRIPENLIVRGGRNAIAIRVFTNQYPLYNGKPLIATTHDAETITFMRKLPAEYFPFALSVIFFMLALFGIIAYITDRSNKLLLRFGIMSTLVTIEAMHYYVPDFVAVSYNTADKIAYALIAVIAYVNYSFLETLLDQKIIKLRIIMAVTALFGAIIALSATAQSPVTGWRMDCISVIGAAGYCSWGILIFTAIRQKKREGLMILGGFVFFLAATLHDILILGDVVYDDSFWQNWGYAVMIFAYGGIILGKNRRMSKDLHSTQKEVAQRNKELSHVMESVRGSVSALGGFYENLQKTAGSLQMNMDEQGSSLEETSSAMVEVSSSVELVSRNALDFEGIVSGTKETLGSYIESSKGIASSAQKAAALSATSQERTKVSRMTLGEVKVAMDRIKDSTGSIRAISEIINDIAEKTNLLSLNASIEAARAGNYGRGFAVVADEIGKLADQSIDQAKTIQLFVEKIVTDIEGETKLIERSVSSIGEIEGAVNDVNSGISTILSLCTAQGALTGQIENNMHLVLKGAGEISVATKEETKTIEEISTAVDLLSDIMQRVISGSSELMKGMDTLKFQIDSLEKMLSVKQ